MDSIAVFFDYIGKTNLFNFIIFLSIIIYLCNKIDLNGKLESQKKNVANEIEHSKSEKQSSEESLKKIEDSVARIGEEIEQILAQADTNAEMVGSKILEDANKAVQGIQNNSKSAINTKALLLKNDILLRASKASIDVAKNQIIKELNSNPDLHNKLIDESLEAINGVNL